MNKLNIETIHHDRVTIEIRDSSDGIEISLDGDIDMEDPGVILDPLFEKIHTGSVNSGIKNVTADFTRLNFLNSSGIKAIAKWIMKLTAVSDEQRYTINIVHNKNITWQVTSLPTLTYLLPDVVKIN